MSAFFCPECSQYESPEESMTLDSGKVICGDCYDEHLCACGEEQPKKEDMCWDCMWEASH